MNYLALIGDMGSILSGGQKQRILLARALYQQPDVLFLDEGTANLDVETESQIVELVRSLDITRIIVAHRPCFPASQRPSDSCCANVRKNDFVVAILNNFYDAPSPKRTHYPIVNHN